MFRIIKWLIALPIGIFIFFNAYVYGNIITYRAVAPHQTAFMSMRMKQFEQEAVSYTHLTLPTIYSV